MTVASQALKAAFSRRSILTFCAAIVIAAMSSANAWAVAASTDRYGDFSVGVRQGIYHMFEVDAFTAIYKKRARYEVKDSNSTGIFPYVRMVMDKSTALELEYGREGGIGPTIQTVAFSAVKAFKYEKNGISPYARAGVLLSRVKWKEVPGSFNTGLGWLVGGGAERKVGRVIISTELHFRNVKNQYVRDPGAMKPPPEIDLSGLGLRVGVELRH